MIILPDPKNMMMRPSVPILCGVADGLSFFVCLISTALNFGNSKILEPLRRNGLGLCSLVGLRLLVGVIRRSNAKPLWPSRFSGSAQFKMKNTRKLGVIAAQGLPAFLGFCLNSSQIVVKPHGRIREWPSLVNILLPQK